MSTSGGGGYCDCGDKEAWKSDPFCDVHTVGEESEESAPAPCPLDTLPPDLAARARQLFSATINYATQLLTWTDTEVLPPDLMPQPSSSSPSASAGKLDDTYTTMLFNDEVHTYEQVSTRLRVLRLSTTK
jgi:E3 ubiquitin-protein ligase UBR2